MGTPAEQWIHHEVPVSQFHLEQFKHFTRNQVLQLQVHNRQSTAEYKQKHINKHKQQYKTRFLSKTDSPRSIWHNYPANIADRLHREIPLHYRNDTAKLSRRMRHPKYLKNAVLFAIFLSGNNAIFFKSGLRNGRECWQEKITITIQMRSKTNSEMKTSASNVNHQKVKDSDGQVYVTMMERSWKCVSVC